MSAKQIAVIGSGPAGLMCATRLVEKGATVHLYEKRTGLGRKLLIAGSSGLNITHEMPLVEFAKTYSSPTQHSFFVKNLEKYPPKNWLSFLEQKLGMETFLGTSSRYFVREMKASNLLKQWTEYLKKQGVQIYTNHELIDFDAQPKKVQIKLRHQEQVVEKSYDSVCLALGGASWEDQDVPAWVSIFTHKQIGYSPFVSSNVGYEVQWPKGFFEECGRAPLKNVVLTTKKGTKEGEILITEYGLEGTPVYFLGIPCKASIDLKPAWSEKQVAQKMSFSQENLSPIRRAKKFLNLSPPALSLLFFMTNEKDRADIPSLAKAIKKLPIELKKARPLSEAISSSGGIQMGELNADLMLKKHSGVFLCGEMLDWDAPTGGFLIQGCVLQGSIAAEGLAAYENLNG